MRAVIENASERTVRPVLESEAAERDKRASTPIGSFGAAYDTLAIARQSICGYHRRTADPEKAENL